MASIVGTRRGLMAACLAAALVGAAPAAMAASHYRAYIDGPWGQIHVRVDGEGEASRPTVLLLHKMVWSSVEFANVQPLLAQAGVRSIAIDIPGYGLSDAPSREPTAEEYAESMIRVLDHFKLKKANLLGIDSGATIMAVLAKLHPERVERLILDGPPAFSREQSAELLKEKEFDRGPEKDGQEFVRRWRETMTMAGGDMSLQAAHQGVMEFFTAAPTYLYGHHAIFKHDLQAAMKQLKVPTLIINSGTGARLAKTLEAAKLRPDFAYVDLKFPGVHVSYDDPKPWAEAVAAYVKGTTKYNPAP